nr:reverse transcriptase domain-containing protein [Tanacetum cinerariifolium]
MHTRSRSRHKIAEPLRIEFPSQEDQFQEDPPDIPMADNRTMAQLLQAPTVGHDKEDPHVHIRYFNKITSTMRVPNVPNSMIKLMLFPFSLEGDTRIWLEKEPPRSILTWDDLVSKFINQFFPISKSTNLRNEIMRFQQRFDESFFEAWDRFSDLVRACPHHGFSELHQLDTFYNALNVNDQDSLNSAAGGNFLDKMPSDCLKIIESKSKVLQSRAKAVVSKVNSSSSTPAISSDVAELKDMVRALLLDKKKQSSALAQSHTPAPVKAVEPNCVTCGGSGTLLGNTITNPKEDLKGITTRRDVAYQGPIIPTPSKVVKQGTEVTKDQVQTPNSQGTAPVQPPVVQSQSKTLVSEPVVAPVSESMPNLKLSIPYPSRHDNERRRDQANKQIKKFYKIFKDISFEISFTDALILMPKFASTLKDLIGNKEKLSEMARTPMNEHCSAVILNKLPKKLADRSVSKPIGIAKYVSVRVGVFYFPADFVVVDFEPDPRVPLILGRCFLKTGRAVIDVHKGELTLHIRNEAITYNLDQTSRYLANYDQMTANKIGVTDEACEEYSQEVLGFSDVTASGSPTPSDDPIVSTTSPTLTPFGDSDYLLFEEANAFLGLEDDPDSPKFNPFYYDPEGDILMLEAILNTDPLPPFPNHEQSMPSVKNELKACEAKKIKSSIDKPPEVELKDLPPHLEYVFLEGDNKLPVIIAKELRDEEKSALIKVLKSYKRAIAWKLFDIQEKTTFTCPYVTFAYRRMPFGLCNAPGTFQRCMLAIFHDMVEKTMEVFMDDFSVFRNSFENCLSRLDKMLQRTKKEMLAVVYALEKFWSYLIMNKCTVHTDHSALKYLFAKKDAKARLLWWVLLLQEFDFYVTDTKGAENLASDHLSRLENPYENVLDLKEINETFPLETLSMVTFRGDSGALWFTDFANYHAGNFIVKGNKYILVAADYLSKWVEAKSLPTNDARVICKFLKSLFARFGAPHAIISDHDTHFCNDQFAKVICKYGVTHRLSTVYHPQTSGQVEVSNRGLKQILKRTIGQNRASWSDKLDDALSAFRTAYKTPIGCTPYKLVYGKACHLPMELEHKAYWALKQANFDLSVAGDHRKIQLNELNELSDQAYENSLIYKEKTKRIHDSKIKNRFFNVGDQVLLFNSRLKIFSGKLKTR